MNRAERRIKQKDPPRHATKAMIRKALIDQQRPRNVIVG